MHVYKDGPALSAFSHQFRQIPLLQTFADGHLKEILNVSRMLVFGPDELIIPQGAFGDRLYVLVGGKVRVVKNKSPIAVLDQIGEVFGELSALAGDVRTASVFAVETTWCLELSPAFAERLPPQERNACYALLYRFIAQVVADRLRKTTDELALTVQDLEITRRKLAELRKTADRKNLNDELELAIEQLRHTKEKLSRLGRPAEEPPVV